MAKVATVPAPIPAHDLSNGLSIDKNIFPDGLRTSGQHNPIYSRLRSYSEFPRTVTGPTVWRAEDYKHNPERWTHGFSGEEIAELSKAADDFIASKTPLTGITKELFPLPHLASLFGIVKKELLNGRGFILFKGIPVQDWSLEKSAVSEGNRHRHS